MAFRNNRKILKEERRHVQRRYEKERRINLRATPGPHEFALVLDGLKPTYNVGKIFRSADAFGAAEVHLIGIQFFDPSPGMGSFKWVPARWHDAFATCHADLSARGYTLFVAEPVESAALPTLDFPRKSAFIFGHEEFGISFDKADFPDLRSVMIPQFGRVQSLNVSVAASIVMYEYVRQHVAEFPPPPAPVGREAVSPPETERAE
ncbi:MAG: TrmH family RNA methyltransferase [Desulfococcaceae bacterium]